MAYQAASKDELRWFGAGALFVFAVVLFFRSFSFVALLLGVIQAAFFSPPVREWFHDREFPELELKPKLFLVGALTAVQLGCSSMAETEREQSAQAERLAAATEKLKQRRAADKEQYFQQKADILSRIETQREQGDFTGAAVTLSKYKEAGVADAELARASLSLDAAKARIQLKDESTLSLEIKAGLYKVLAENDPSDQSAAYKAKTLGKELAEQQAREAAENARKYALARRKQNIEKQFSSWDGSHHKLEREVKARMNNPKSYEHVETRFLDTGTAIIVWTKFRGSNAFGGVVINGARAEVDESGNVLSLEWER